MGFEAYKVYGNRYGAQVLRYTELKAAKLTW